LDGNASAFSAAEAAAMEEIWARVAEMYAPFNVNVTTRDPGSYVAGQTMRVVVGNAAGATMGGYAFVNGFLSGATTGYVFPANLANNTKIIALAVAHEAGHGFGLQHQSTYSGTTRTNEYHPGNSAWAPIMGLAYYSARGTWWNGPNSMGWATMQDDMAVIARTQNGFGYRPDDHASVFSSAAAVTVANSAFSVSGVIEQTTDRDVFRFTTSASGTVTLNLSVAQYGAMLDGTLQIWDSQGNVLHAAATSSLGETLSVNLTAGTYYAAVLSAGRYGDVGQYTLSGTLPAGGTVAPVASIAAAGSVAEGGSSSLSGTNSTGTGLVYTWDLDGDGIFGETGAAAGRGNEAGSSVTFSALGLDGPGTFVVSLRVTDSLGQTSTTSHTFTITNVAPTITLGGNASVNEGSQHTLTFAATDPGADTISSWLINWGDGTTSTVAGNVTSATKTYADNGTYTITVTATDEDGTYTATRALTVNNVAPTLTIGGPSTRAEGATYTLTLASSDPGADTLTGWLIDWGDGTTSTAAGNATSIAKVYADNGTYVITATATDEDGTYASNSKTVTITNVAPTITVTGGGAATAGNAYTINWTVTDPGADTVTSWTIDWGDGTTTTHAGNLRTASRTYAAAGNYSVIVRGTDEDGTHAAAAHAVAVSAAPTIAASGSGSASEGSAYTLTLAASGFTPGSWTIAWGDGSTTTLAGTATTATKTYADNGTYSVAVTATSGGTTYTAAAHAVTITNVAPTITLGGNASVNEGSQHTLTFSATDPGSDTISSWFIQWGDGSTTTVAGAATSATKTYADNGSYTITVTATDEDGSYTATRALTVNNVAPTLTIGGPSTRAEGATYTLTLASSDPGADTLSSWTIFWGDGTSSTVAGNATTASKIYADNGSYTITATATDEDGTYASNNKSVTITNVAPTITVTGGGTVQAASAYTIGFGATDPGADTITSWTIDWGDGTTTTHAGSVSSASRTYATPGSYGIVVRATDEDGTHAAAPHAVTVTALPISITATGTGSGLEGSPYTLTLGATNLAVGTWSIAWGDGTTTTHAGSVTSATHTYADNGNYVVTAVAIAGGVNYPAASHAVAIANVAPTFTVVAGSGAEGSPITLQLGASDPGDDTVSWAIDWGDGTTAAATGNARTLLKTYADSGVYTIRITPSDEDGTYAAITRSATIVDVPPTFSITAPGVARVGSDYTIRFSASDVGADTITAWTIDWGDGTTTTLAADATTATHRFTTSGALSLVVRATDEDGTHAAAPVLVQVAERNAPVYTLEADNITGETTAHRITLRGVAEDLINLDTVGNTAISVVSDKGVALEARLVQTMLGTDGSTVTLVFEISKPDRSFFNYLDYGTRYDVSLLSAGGRSDSATPGLLGSFFAAVPANDRAGNDLTSANHLGILRSGLTRTRSDYLGVFDRVDVYRFRLSRTSAVTVRIDGFEKDCNVRLLDAEGNAIATRSKVGLSPEVLTVPSLRTGWYYIQVVFADDVGTAYRLRLVLEPPQTMIAGRLASPIAQPIPTTTGSRIAALFSDRPVTVLSPQNDEWRLAS
jgi:PKD repeat protein